MNVTKAQMLIDLKNNILDINILPVYVVNSADLIIDRKQIIANVIDFAEGHTLIIRSSSVNEDTNEYSNAGKFESILNVEPIADKVENALMAVFESYGKGKLGESDANEEILVQPMMESVTKSGVIFTRDIDTNAKYYVANFHEGSDTAAVTSGESNDLRTFVSYKHSSYEVHDADMKALINYVKKIEEYLENDALDIEFAVDKNHKVYILQCRPIAKGKKNIRENLDIAPVLNRIYKKAQKLAAPHPFLLGHTTCFGVMPDWNPAEILGIRPKKLAISLYKELITDSIWAHQRKNYGYRDLTMHPLMISFCGIPYIDTRVTFNSFIPAKLNERIAEKLANYYIDTLAAYPKYHDKIEFEIVYSCYYLGIHDKLRKLLNYGFNENEITRIEFSLLDITNQIISPENGLYKEDIKKIERLKTNHEKIINSDISLVDRIYWLIEECKEYGTLPFAGIARAGFIAVQFLRSFVDTGIITQDECDAYMNSLNTVNKQMSCDLKRYYAGQISKDEFLNIYGHIRPGTYDIMSKRYDEAFNEYFSDKKSDGSLIEKNKVFSFTTKQIERIQQELDENGLLINADELLDFIKTSIEGREQLKFIFTKSVSEILRLVGELGERVNIDKEDLAHLDISVVKQLYVDLHTGKIDDLFRQNIKNNKLQYERAMQIKLPSIIVNPDDVYNFYLLDEEPNFITQKSVVADTRVLHNDNDLEEMSGNIVLIQSADPGYDFVFTKNIAGLITQFGGANSHMAIRCAELGIPAVIGVGESRFNEWSKWQMIELDCLKRQVIRIE